MKPLIVIRYSKDTEADDLINVNQYIKNHPAKDDYHFFIVVDPEWIGPIDSNTSMNILTNLQSTNI